ncbi:MAG: ribonuclease PH [Propionibacteriaceae bacterium]|jgi:hypothetical protein|nr:ribonuclease PH [Propionibacteriaceae bacterium]
MKRKAVLDKLKAAAKAQGKTFATRELTRHTGVTVGGASRTLGRHAEVDDATARKFWGQFDCELGRGWWR